MNGSRDDGQLLFLAAGLLRQSGQTLRRFPLVLAAGLLRQSGQTLRRFPLVLAAGLLRPLGQTLRPIVLSSLIPFVAHCCTHASRRVS
jgi:hypothetical protein